LSKNLKKWPAKPANLLIRELYMQQNVTLFFTELLVGLDEMYHLT
jgi:hypothetical protein